MSAQERMVAGLRCGEVLGALGDYVDGELDPEQRARIQAHLRGCDVCERFGGKFSEVVALIRRTLDEVPEQDDPDALARVRAKLLGF